MVSCAQYFKDTIQKQFTTKFIKLDFLLIVVLSISKIQFKSNSQPLDSWSDKFGCCAQYFKDTIQKQFTTTSYVIR